MFAFPHTLPPPWIVFYYLHHLKFLAERILSEKHPQVLQLGRHIYVKMDVLFCQKRVQVHRIPLHAADQYLKSTETLNISKQPIYKVFFLEIKNGSFFKHQNHSSFTKQIQNLFFHNSCLSRLCEYHEKSFWAAVQTVG